MSALKALTLASLLLIFLAAKPTTPADAGPKKPDAGVVDAGPADAGTTDAGLDKDAVTKRRFKLLMNVNEFKAAMEESGAVVKIDEILFATGPTPTNDAAMVLGSINGKRLGNFFIFTDDKWSVFPTDFGSESVPAVP